MTYNIISTGSKGNAVVINGRILIDCGVPFKALEPVKKDLRLVLLDINRSSQFGAIVRDKQVGNNTCQVLHGIYLIGAHIVLR